MIELVLFLYLVFIVLMLVGIYWYWESKRRGGRKWLASKGELVPDPVTKDSVRMFSDPDIERIDLKDFKIDRKAFYRMRVHLRMDCGISFELMRKIVSSGKVYEPGEGTTGIEGVDKQYWTESPDMKTTIQVLGAPTVQNALLNIKDVYSIHVMGDEIEIVFGFRNELLKPIYEFVLALTHEMMDRR